MATELLQQNGDISVSHNNAEVVGVAYELKELTTDPTEVVVRPEVARAKLAVCARTVWWCPTVARPRQGWLGGDSNLAKVLQVMSRWRQSGRCNGSSTNSSGEGALQPTHADTILSTR